MAKRKQKPVLAWWFCAEPKLPHGDGRPVVVGETLTVEEWAALERALGTVAAS